MKTLHSQRTTRGQLTTRGQVKARGQRAIGAAILSALIAAGFGAGIRSAAAADLGGSIKDAPVYAEEAPRFSWTGFYLGANLGGAWSAGEARYSQDSGFGAFTADSKSSSAIGGGQIGYNWQAGQLVVGVEADIAAQKLSSSTTAFPFGNGFDSASVSRSSRWVGTVRPRIGYAAGSALLYVTGGLAYGNVVHGYEESRITVAGQNRSFSDSSTRVGWTAGAGIEWALNRNWTLGAEYLHIDLGSTTLNAAASTAGGLGFVASSGRFEDREDIVRAKLNYKF